MNQNAAASSVDKAHGLIDQGAIKAENGAHQAVDFTARAAHKAVDTTAGLAGQARSQCVTAQRQARTKVNEHPVRALAIAIGLGTLVGWLARRHTQRPQAPEESGLD